VVVSNVLLHLTFPDGTEDLRWFRYMRPGKVWPWPPGHRVSLRVKDLNRAERVKIRVERCDLEGNRWNLVGMVLRYQEKDGGSWLADRES
jgi:hypothetical protein